MNLTQSWSHNRADPSRLARPGQRLAVARLLFDAARVTRDECGTLSCEQYFLVLAITIGQVENRPFTLTKLATFVGMPRSTVDRRLRDLVRRGFVERRGNRAYYLVERRANADSSVRAFEKIAALIQSTAVELSKVDSAPVLAS